MFVCPFFSPDDVQSIISGKLALRYSGSQVSKLKNHAVFSIELTVSEMLQ